MSLISLDNCNTTGAKYAAGNAYTSGKLSSSDIFVGFIFPNL